MYKQFTTDILHLPTFILNNEGERVKDGWVLGVELKPQNHLCPLCFQESINHARNKNRFLRHAWVSTRETIYIRVPVHRQRCEDCGITWTVEWPEVPVRGNVTTHFKQMIARKCIGQSFEAVAREMAVPPSTVASWFYTYAEETLARPADYEAPPALCMDEFAHKRGHTYSVALQDAHTGHVWQTHPGKSRERIQEGLRRYPFQAPEVIVTDLAPGMAQTVHEIWPETAIVVDKFHVIQLFTQALDRARKLEGNNGTSHKNIRHQRRLLMARPKHLKLEEKETLRTWLGENPELKKQWVALQKFRDIYCAKSYKKAQKALEDWCSHYLFEGANATKSIVKTVLKWKQEILNHFTYGLTNARLEGTNNLIKTLKRRSYGCPNMYHFDLRIRMECRPPA
ncbi:ISL3 family transposase [Salinicoccus siamensis]|uniref:ISL3 family transposase n=1 Tax=Salinicoccus siamensis TaxID=381830 RepID=UPI00360E8B13